MRSHGLFTLLFIAVIAALFSIAIGGCSQGQMTPSEVKANVYGARADAIGTVEAMDKIAAPIAESTPAEIIDYWKGQAQMARTSLVNIGGTPAHYYDDGFLGPVYRWMTGTKPQWFFAKGAD